MIFIFCFQYNYRDTQAKVTKAKDEISEKKLTRLYQRIQMCNFLSIFGKTTMIS